MFTELNKIHLLQYMLCEIKGVGRFIGAPMHGDTKFDDIQIDTHNH